MPCFSVPNFKNVLTGARLDQELMGNDFVTLMGVKAVDNLLYLNPKLEFRIG